MGQKVHPTGIRLGIVKKHTSVWYAGQKEYAEKLNADLKVREFITKELSHASVSRVEIERPAQSARITIHTARPGIVIGKKGEDVEKLRAAVAAQMGVPVHINIEEDTEQFTPMTSRIAHLMIIDMLAVAVTQRRGPEFAQHLNAIKHSIRSLRQDD